MLRIDDTERLSIGVPTSSTRGQAGAPQPAGGGQHAIGCAARRSTALPGRAEEDADFRREVTLKRRVVVRDCKCRIQGRVDGLSTEGERTVVEEEVDHPDGRNARPAHAV